MNTSQADMSLKVEYPYIYAWGRLMGSFNYYIEGQMNDAKIDKAPSNAIYKNAQGWVTFDTISASTNQETYYFIIREVDKINKIPAKKVVVEPIHTPEREKELQQLCKRRLWNTISCSWFRHIS